MIPRSKKIHLLKNYNGSLKLKNTSGSKKLIFTNFRINNTHTFLAGGFAYITEAFDPLYRPPSEGTDDKPEEGLVPRKGLNQEDEITTVRIKK